jgi:hypothetical protein
MAIDLRFPNITGATEREQLAQVKSYLHQLVEQLQWALKNVDTSSNTVVATPIARSLLPAEQTSTKDSQATFNSIKPLIIKSAEIVQAYYEEISSRLGSKYVAQSEFGTFVEENEQEIKKNSTGIEQLFSNLQTIFTDIDNINFTLAEVNAHIKSGLLYYDDEGLPVYGLEIGQKNAVDGVEVFNKFARFTSDRLSFYDQNDTEVAYISDYKLYITHAEVTGSIKLGGFLIDTTNGLAIKWVGRS